MNRKTIEDKFRAARSHLVHATVNLQSAAIDLPNLALPESLAAWSIAQIEKSLQAVRAATVTLRHVQDSVAGAIDPPLTAEEEDGPQDWEPETAA